MNILQSNYSTYQELINHSSDAIFQIKVISKSNFRIIDINPAAEKMFKLNNGELFGKSIDEVSKLNQFLGNSLDSNLRDCIETCSTIVIEDFTNCNSCSKIHDIVLIPILNVDGVVQTITGIAHQMISEFDIKQESTNVNGSAEEMDNAIFLVGKDGNILYANNYSSRITGYSMEELVSLHIKDVDQSISDDNWKHTWHKIKEEESINTRDILRNRNGDCYPVEIRSDYIEYGGIAFIIRSIKSKVMRTNVEPFITVKRDQHLVENLHSKIIGAITVSEDISERRLTEITLENKNQRIEAMIANHPDPIWMKDADGVFLACNESFARRFNKQVTEITGTTDFEHMETHRARILQKKDKKALEMEGFSIDEEWVTFVKDGHCELWETRRVKLLNAEGMAIGIIGFAKDITDKKELEYDLREKEKIQKTLLDSLPFRVWLKDTEGCLLTANQAYANAAGRVSTYELYGKTDFDIWPHDLALLYRKNDQEVLKTARKFSKESFLKTSGGIRWFETYIAPVVVDGVFHSTIGFEFDVSSKKHIEDGR